MAYVPSTEAATRTITVDLARLSGPAHARWYNPTDGTYRPIDGSPLANACAHEHGHTVDLLPVAHTGSTSGTRR